MHRAYSPAQMYQELESLVADSKHHIRRKGLDMPASSQRQKLVLHRATSIPSEVGP
jgi:hypothetical protein